MISAVVTKRLIIGELTALCSLCRSLESPLLAEAKEDHDDYDEDELGSSLGWVRP